MELRGLNQSRVPCPAPTRSLLLSLDRPYLRARRHRSALTPPRLCPSLVEDPLPPDSSTTVPCRWPRTRSPPRLLHRPDLHTDASASSTTTARPHRAAAALGPTDAVALGPTAAPPWSRANGFRHHRLAHLLWTLPAASSGCHRPPA
jgi:hypothetical protein